MCEGCLRLGQKFGFLRGVEQSWTQMRGIVSSDRVLLNVPSEISVSGEDSHKVLAFRSSPVEDVIYSCNLDQSSLHVNFSEGRLLFYFLK